jgi:hypothetical protein
VVSDGDENLSCKMATFLAAMKLVFELDTCGSILSEELGELDDC